MVPFVGIREGGEDLPGAAAKTDIVEARGRARPIAV